jgi:hypothetical protein
VAYSFDGVAKTVTLSSPTSSLTFTTNDLYSRAVDWVQSGDGAGYEFPFATVGGEPIGSGQSAGFFLFLGQSWTIIIPSGIDDVTVQGNLFRDPDDLTTNPLFTNSAGALVTIEKSVVALGYSTGGGGFTSSDRTTLNATATAVSSLNDLSAEQAEAAALAALTAFDPLVAADLDTIESNIGLLLDASYGDYTVDATANTGTIFKLDGTIGKVFDLLDENGNPASQGVHRRVGRIKLLNIIIIDNNPLHPVRVFISGVDDYSPMPLNEPR